MGTPHRHTAGTDSARPKKDTHSRCKYSLLMPTGPGVDPDAAGNQVSGDGHKATRGTAGQAQRETETGDRNRQRALPARSMQGANDEEWRPPEQSRTLNACSHQGEEGGGGTPTQQRAPRVYSQGPGGTPRYGSARP